MNNPGEGFFFRHDLIYSYKILFPENSGSDIRTDAGFDIDSLKTAFRNRAFETHPDRAVQLGMNPVFLRERFIEIKQAYNRVLNYLNSRAEHCSATASFKSRASKHTESTFRSYGLPSIVFLTGQYLLYTGWIRMGDLLEAVRWQRQMRPLFGTIARQFYYMNENDIRTVISSKVLSERFGECALRLGIINSFQFRKILDRQKAIQKPIGEYFVTKGLMSRDQLLKILEEHRIHNERVSALKK